MGSFQSAHVREQETVGEEISGEQQQETQPPRSDDSVDKSCAISEKEVVGDVELSKSVDDGSAEDPDEFESCCDGNLEQCTELADFREDLARKRDLRRAKMADIKQEMEELRASLSEERSKNRALIRYIKSKEPSTNDETAVDVAEALQQSIVLTEDEDSTSARLTLRKDLAESQLQLQQANAELLSLHETIDQMRTQIHALQIPSEQEEAARDERNREFRHLQAQLADAQFNLQISTAEVLSLQTDITQLKNQIKGLKDVIKAGKEIITIREDQVEQVSSEDRRHRVYGTGAKKNIEMVYLNFGNTRCLAWLVE